MNETVPVEPLDTAARSKEQIQLEAAQEFTRTAVTLSLELGNLLLQHPDTSHQAKLLKLRALLYEARWQMLFFPKLHERSLFYLPQINDFLERT